ncbi:MAG: FAD binding domain-containing protein [Lachnospiraceae bacterium]|nr:FAD binding domain-containing protein [Lachnospiraceae bacterium]
MKIKQYVRPASLEEAYELNQKKSARILGGMLWMRLGRGMVQTAVDLSGLGLDQIVETQEEFSIGSMVTLRTLEQHEGLGRYTQGAMREAVHSIVGVQFRNLATVGGSIWGRFGFSDVLTLFLALDTWVELYQGGLVPLAKFAEMKKDNDILVRLIVKKRAQKTVYLSFRNTRTDFPVLTCAVCMENGPEAQGYAVIGARPGRALCFALGRELSDAAAESRRSTSSARGLQKDMPAERALSESVPIESAASEKLELAVRELVQKVPMGSNMRASAEYRSHLAEVLIRRGLKKLQEGELS